jgi:hypothetical protein
LSFVRCIELAQRSCGRAALVAIPRLRSSPLDPAGCALASAYAARVSCRTLPSGFAVLAQ